MGRSYEDRANEAVAQGTWIELAWANIKKPGFLELVYEKALEHDKALAFASWKLFSASRKEPITYSPWMLQPPAALTPLIISRLSGDTPQKGLMFALLFGLDIGEPYYPHLTEADASEDAIRLLAGSPYEADRDAAFALFESAGAKPDSYDSYGRKPTDRLMMAVGFACQNDPRGDEALTEALEHFGQNNVRRTEHDGFKLLIRGLQHRTESDKAPTWSALLTDCFHRGFETFITLGMLVEHGFIDSTKQKLTAFLSQHIDQTAETKAWRVAAQSVLARDPEEAKKIQRSDVDWVVNFLRPVQYSWRKEEHVALVHRLCAELLLCIGGKDDMAWLAGHTYTSSPVLLHVINQERIKRGKLPIEKILYSESMCKHIVETEGVDGLFSLVENASFSGHVVFKMLGDLASEDESLRTRLIPIAKKVLEEAANYPIGRIDDVHRDIRYALYFLERLPAKLVKEACKDTTSPWIREKCLGEKPAYPVAPPTWVEDGVTIRPLANDSFVNAGQIVDMAVSPDGKLLCSVGNTESALYDRDTGKKLGKADLYGYGQACAFSPSGQEVAIGNRYKDVLISSLGSEDEEILYKHNNEVTALAYSGDGASLASVDTGGEVIVWDLQKNEEKYRLKVRGEFHAILFLPDNRVLASYSAKATKKGQSFYLLLIEEDGEKSKKFKQASAVLAMEQHTDGRIAMGTNAGDVIIGEVSAKKLTSLHDGKFESSVITAVSWMGDELWFTTKEGVLGYIELDDGTLHFHEVAKVESKYTAFEALVCCDGVAYAGGTIGRVLTAEDRICNGMPLSHNDKVRAWTSLSDGTLVTLDWSGQVLRWSPDADIPTHVIHLSATGESIAYIDDETVVVGTRKGLRLVNIDEGKVIAETEEDTRLVAPYDDVIAHDSAEGIGFSKVDDFSPTMQEDLQMRGIVSFTVAPNGLDILVGGKGGFVGRWGREGWQWSGRYHGSDRLSLGTPHTDVCNVLLSPDDRFAVTGASDSIVRVLDAKTGEQQLRIQSHFGLFNHMSIDATSRLLAIPYGSALMVVDLHKKEILCRLPGTSFGGTNVTAAIFLDNGRLFAANEGGQMYEVTLPS